MTPAFPGDPPPPSILVVRDPREALQKCSLTPLRGLPGVEFWDFRRDRRTEVGRRILLHAAGDELTEADRGRDLLLIDCSWRHVPEVLATIDGELAHRRLPPLVTAYPRKSRVFADPANGLASVEALYAACAILGHPRPDFLAGYHWRADFLASNPALPRCPS
jgi:rRNA small subunit aminocarboxypropyltransferase